MSKEKEKYKESERKLAGQQAQLKVKVTFQ